MIIAYHIIVDLKSDADESWRTRTGRTSESISEGGSIYIAKKRALAVHGKKNTLVRRNVAITSLCVLVAST